MKAIEFGSRAEQGRCYLERCATGLVVCYLAPEPDGTYTARRDWYSDPKVALAELSKADAVITEQKITATRLADADRTAVLVEAMR
jgi:hypothetical protein